MDSLKTRKKTELFSFLSEQIVKKHVGGKSSQCESVLSNGPCDVSTLQPCNNTQDQARISRHLANDPGHGHHTAYVRTVDCGIVFLVICFFSTLRRPSKLWVGFRSAECTAILPFMIPAPILDLPDMTLPISHVIKRCDTASHFLGCVKKTAWAIHQDSLTNEPSCFTLGYLDVQKLERFAVTMCAFWLKSIKTGLVFSKW